MPYTPPSHRSPASSTPASPDASRRPSFQAGGRPSLPRSASYLTRHRRTPSAVSTDSHGSARQITPDATSEDLKAMATSSSSSVRQSPPPVTDDRQLPKGAVLSPPESPPSSDEDELPEVRGRRINNLKELHDAISQIPQHRESSPTKAPAASGASDVLLLPSQAGALHQSFSTGALEELAHAAGARRISHVRSGTDPGALVTKSADNSLTASEEESEEEILKKPQMVRKKSGELVRPALRPPSRRRPSSMPGTPTFSKAVHFDSHLEHVRHFLQVDRPLAVSAGSSPADNYESDCEYPFPGDERRTPPFEWEIIVTNFPLETAARRSQAVRLERVWLSNDQKCLTGSIAVANLAFQKSVACRFTLDYWKTTSEVAAEYVAEMRPKETPQGHDRFQFTIKLSDLANLESKTLYFCVRYNVAGREFWDNNSGINFQVDFKKKMLPQNGKNGIQGAASRPAGAALPRSNRRANPSTAPRPRSMPVGFDDFGAAGKIDFTKTPSLQDYLGEPGPALRLKGVKSTTSLPSDNLTSRLSSPSGQAFANRYDFGASLSAAVQAAKDSMSKPDGLYMRSARKATPFAAAAAAAASSSDKTAASAAAKEPSAANESSAAVDKALPSVPSGIGSPSMSNASYDEIVSKYCFYGSKQSSPQIKDGTLRSGQLDGVGDSYATRTTNSSSSSLTGSPLQMGSLRHSHGAQHHSLRPADPNPYFEHAAVIALTGSPASSPLHHPSQRTSAPAAHQPRISPAASSQASNRSVSPASMVGAFAPLAGTSPNDFPFAQLQDRFPFIGTETHTATAIRG